jgi:predicted nucleic acid-binding protein
MKVVVDTNIFFSATITQNGRLRQALFTDDVEFVTPHFSIIELFKYKDKIIKLARQEEAEVLTWLYDIMLQVNYVNEKTLSVEARQQAYDLCKDVDIKDLPFVALTIELDALLWTGDKKLKNALKLKGFDRFYEI